MVFTKDDASTSNEKVEKLTREFNIHYRACIGSLIYLLYTRVDFIFTVHQLEKFSSNPGKVKLKDWYIRYNKTLVLKYYADMKDEHSSDLLIQTNINTKNQLMAFSDSSWQDFPDNRRSTGTYIIFYKGGPIDHVTHVPGAVSQLGAESDYNVSCTSGMALAHSRMLTHEVLNK